MNTTRAKTLTALLASGLLAFTAACGDDDEPAPATQPPQDTTMDTSTDDTMTDDTMTDDTMTDDTMSDDTTSDDTMMDDGTTDTTAGG